MLGSPPTAKTETVPSAKLVDRIQKSNELTATLMHLLRISIALIVVLTSVGLAQAEEYSFELRGPDRRIVGSMLVSLSDVATLSTTIDGLPLKALNTSFYARQTTNEYRSEKANELGPRREILIGLERGSVLDVRIKPASEMTKFSYPAAVIEQVISPVDAILKAMTLDFCGSSNIIYDGRRIVDLVMNDLQDTGDGDLSCTGEYRVRLGPGHGSLLNLRSFPVTAHFNQATQRADDFETQVFGFHLTAVRTNQDQ